MDGSDGSAASGSTDGKARLSDRWFRVVVAIVVVVALILVVYAIVQATSDPTVGNQPLGFTGHTIGDPAGRPH